MKKKENYIVITETDYRNVLDKLFVPVSLAYQCGEEILKHIKRVNRVGQVRVVDVFDYAGLKTANEGLNLVNKDLHKENEKLKSALEEIEKICLEQNLKWDNIARDILCIIDKAKEENDE